MGFAIELAIELAIGLATDGLATDSTTKITLSFQKILADFDFPCL